MEKEKKKNIVVGVDIGTTKVSVIVAEKNKDGLFNILGTGMAASFGVMKGEVANINKTVQAIKEATVQAETESGYKIEEVYAGIAGSHIESMQHRGSLIRSNSTDEISVADIKTIMKDMYKVALKPGIQIIHVIPQEYFVDGLSVGDDPVGMCGSRIEADYHIITGRISAAQNIERSISKAGLKMVGLILEPLASAASVLDEAEKEAGVVLVDIGGGTTDVAVFYDKVIRHTAVIPFGGNILTKDIEKGCHILNRQAELLKVRFGSAMTLSSQENKVVSIPGLRGRPAKEISVKNLSSIIRARMEEIIEQVYYEIKLSHYVKKLRAGIVLTGGGAQLKHIKALVEFSTGMDVRIGEPLEKLTKDYDIKLASPVYATGLGLLSRAQYEIEEESTEVEGKETTMNEEEKEVEEHKLMQNKEHRPLKQWWKRVWVQLPKYLLDEDDTKDYE